jgi:hypothetical protein
MGDLDAEPWPSGTPHSTWLPQTMIQLPADGEHGYSEILRASSPPVHPHPPTVCMGFLLATHQCKST